MLVRLLICFVVQLDWFFLVRGALRGLCLGMEFHPRTNSAHTRIPVCRMHRECREQRVVVVVGVDVIAVVVVVSDVKTLTIKITHSACTKKEKEKKTCSFNNFYQVEFST